MYVSAIECREVDLLRKKKQLVLTNGEFVRQQVKTIAEQHRGGEANNSGVDFERSYVAWTLCISLHRALTAPRFFEAVVTHQARDRVDDVKLVLGSQVRASQLKSGDSVGWTDDLASAFDAQMRLNHLKGSKAKLELVVTTDELRDSLRAAAGVQYAAITFKSHPKGKFTPAAHRWARWRNVCQELSLSLDRSDLDCDLIAGTLLLGWETAPAGSDVGRIANRLSYGIVGVFISRFVSDVAVSENMKKAMAAILDWSLSLEGDSFVYRADTGEDGIIPFRIGTLEWHVFEGRVVERAATSVHQIWDLIWNDGSSDR